MSGLVAENMGSLANIHPTPLQTVQRRCGCRCVCVAVCVWQAKEKARIVASGGTVVGDRVNGSLAVARSLGDFAFKRNAAKSASEQAVTAVPDVTVLPRAHDDEFVILACDGVWDVLTSAQAGQFLRDKVEAGVGEPLALAEALVDEALLRGSMDNLSAIVLALPGAPTPTP